MTMIIIRYPKIFAMILTIDHEQRITLGVNSAGGAQLID